jgi:NAD(P)-dependent dehydrogenase (short-subunit alcohol dehydrogenase family)
MPEENDRGGRLAGKVAVVTGATSGSGRAVAKLFAAEGAQLFLLARGEKRLRDLEAQLGPDSVGIPTDIGNPDDVRAAFEKIEEQQGKLDILINNAAVYRPYPFEKLPDEEIMTLVRTNLLGPIYAARAAIPLMRAAGGGEIVNTSSEATIESFPLMSMYTVTKAGLEALGQALRTEFEKEEIRVTTLIQGVALGEGGGSTDWELDSEFAELSFDRLMKEGIIHRVMGLHGGQNVDSVAEVHLFVVTRPRGQKLDVIRARSY